MQKCEGKSLRTKESGKICFVWFLRAKIGENLRKPAKTGGKRGGNALRDHRSLAFDPKIGGNRRKSGGNALRDHQSLAFNQKSAEIGGNRRKSGENALRDQRSLAFDQKSAENGGKVVGMP